MFETYCLDCQVCPWGCSPLPFILLLSYCSTYLNIGPQGRSPSTLPQYWAPNSGAVPPPFDTTAIILQYLLLYWAPGPFPLYFTTILGPGAVPLNGGAVPPPFYTTAIILHYLLLYWAPGPFPLLSGAVPPLFCTAAVVLCFLLDMAINVGSQDSLTITCPRTVFPTGWVHLVLFQI